LKSSSVPLVIDVGQCDHDHGQIRNLLQSLGAEVLRAGTHDEATAMIKARTPQLVLVNRINDVDGAEGLDLIRQLLPAGFSPVMLVSNLPEAQQAAVKVGALLGFGKAELKKAETAERLSAALQPR
jgi:PleD family two-component response regulator